MYDIPIWYLVMVVLNIERSKRDASGENKDVSDLNHTKVPFLQPLASYILQGVIDPFWSVLLLQLLHSGDVDTAY